MYSKHTVSLSSKFDDLSQTNTELFSRINQESISGVRELLDIQSKIASKFIGWWLSPRMPLRKGHNELMPLMFSLFHRNFFNIYSAMKLTLSGFYESARPLLRCTFESLMISKFCHICENDQVMKKWDAGQTIYFANAILKKIESPNTKPFYEFWALICEHSHATKGSMQVSIELKGEDEQHNIATNLAMLNALLECNYHLLNRHLITPELSYMDKFYSTRIKPKLREYDTPVLKERAHNQFKKNRAFLGAASIQLISAYKRKWIIK